jgi:4-hydroxy-tetrahydrodipicolinate synthase
MQLEGVMTAIISPMKDNKLDLESFKKLLSQQYENGVKSFVINGTTGESPSLEWEEVELLVSTAKSHLPDASIVIGAGGNATHKVVKMAKKAEAIGADAILSVVPYYNKPTQEGLYQHFKEVAAAVKCPVILYNVPGRTITSLSLDTIKRLSKIDNIKAIKEASGEVSFVENILAEVPELKVLSGDDGTYLEAALKGCHGVISVISHVLPKEFVDWTDRAKNSDNNILEEYKAYANFCDLLFKEPNPVPVKACLKHMGIIASDELRLPLVPCSDSLREELNSEMLKLNIGN